MCLLFTYYVKNLYTLLLQYQAYVVVQYLHIFNRSSEQNGNRRLYFLRRNYEDF